MLTTKPVAFADLDHDLRLVRGFDPDTVVSAMASGPATVCLAHLAQSHRLDPDRSEQWIFGAFDLWFANVPPNQYIYAASGNPGQPCALAFAVFDPVCRMEDARTFLEVALRQRAARSA